MAPKLLNFEFVGRRGSPEPDAGRRDRARLIGSTEINMIAIVVFILAFPALRKYVYPVLEGLRDVREASSRSRREPIL
jgi:hypothetical protein